MRLQRAVERTALVSEQVAAEQLRSDRAAIHRDESSVATAQIVHRACDEFLAGAALAMNEYVHVERRDPPNLREQFLHRRGLADHVAESVGLLGLAKLRAHVSAIQQGAEHAGCKWFHQVLDNRCGDGAHG